MMNRFVNDNSHMQLFSVLQRHSVGDTPFCRDVMTWSHLDQYDTSSHFGPSEKETRNMHQIETVRSLYSHLHPTVNYSEASFAQTCRKMYCVGFNGQKLKAKQTRLNTPFSSSIHVQLRFLVIPIFALH